MEITINSAQGLRKPSSSIFSQHLQTFINLTTTPSTPSSHHDHLYTTTVDHHGGHNPTWDHKFDLSNVINDTFFHNKNNNSYIYLHLYTNRFLLGPKFLGWCGIPASDIADGFSPVGTTRHLSYRLRKKDGSRGHGFVNVVVKLESSFFRGARRDDCDVQRLPEIGFGRVAIGIPVRTLPVVGDVKSLNYGVKRDY